MYIEKEISMQIFDSSLVVGMWMTAENICRYINFPLPQIIFAGKVNTFDSCFYPPRLFHIVLDFWKIGFLFKEWYITTLFHYVPFTQTLISHVTCWGVARSDRLHLPGRNSYQTLLRCVLMISHVTRDSSSFTHNSNAVTIININA